MKKLLTCLALSLVAASSYAATPLWLRDVQISPDGTEIAFCYKGDIYKVPSNGGTATNSLHKPHTSAAPSGHRIVNRLPSPVTAMAISTCSSCRPMAEQPGALPPIRLPKYRQPSPPTATISCSRPLSKTLPTVPCSLPRP